MSVHVYPVNEEHQHDLEGNGECACEPYVEWLDDETGLPYEDGPLVIHERFDSAGWVGIDRPDTP